MSEVREHDFALILSGIPLADAVGEDDPLNAAANALYEAGCDDATLSLQRGVHLLDFARTAPSLAEAIVGAILDVQRNTAGIDVLRVDSCRTVTQAEIAARMGVSRQAVHQYISGQRGPGGFPPPECHVVDHQPLWAWCEVAYWLRRNGMIAQEVADDARALDLINLALQCRDTINRDRSEFAHLLEAIFGFDLTRALASATTP